MEILGFSRWCAREAAGLPSATSMHDPSLDGFSHGRRHQYRLLRMGHRRVEQYPIAAHFHGNGRIRGGADARVHDDWHLGVFHDQADVVGVENAQPGTDQRAGPADGDELRSPTKIQVPQLEFSQAS